MSEEISRRSALIKLGVLINGAVAAVLAVPVIGYLFSSILRQRDYSTWVALGPLSQFPEGHTRLATYKNPLHRSWDGETADIPCWVRRVDARNFQVFAINCAHLGCPVRWFPQSQLFMCPCHGGVYYADGSRASGPPDRGLFQYLCRIESDQLMIKAGELPTLSTKSMMSTAGEHS
jgi:quinol---cytochrome c reductase iron-sulfur subunit, bacillus type